MRPVAAARRSAASAAAPSALVGASRVVMFSGFDRERLERDPAELHDRLADKYGDGPSLEEKFASSAEVTRDWTEADYRAAVAEADSLNRRLLAVMRPGAAVDSPEIFAILDDHHAGVTRFWAPDRESYTGLGDLYVEHEKFRAMYTALDQRYRSTYGTRWPPTRGRA